MRIALSAARVAGDDELSYHNELGADRCAVIGNGANDAQVLAAVTPPR